MPLTDCENDITCECLIKRGIPVASREEDEERDIAYIEAWSYRGNIYMVRYDDEEPGVPFYVDSEKKFFQTIEEGSLYFAWDVMVSKDYVDSVLDDSLSLSVDYEWNCDSSKEEPENPSGPSYASGADAETAPVLRRTVHDPK